MRINAVWKLIYFINGISSVASALPTGPGLRSHIFFKLLCLSLPGSLSIFFLPFFLCLSSLLFFFLWKPHAGLWQMSRIISFGFSWMKCVCMCVFVHLCGSLIFMLCQLWRAYLIYDIFTVKEKNRYLEQWFSNWGPRPPGGPLDGTRGAAKKF